MPARARLVATLARRFARGAGLPASVLVVLATATVLTAVYVILSGIALSGAQLVERDLGRFDQLADLGQLVTVKPGEEGPGKDLVAAARDSGAVDPTVSLTSFDLQLATEQPPLVMYVEAEWSHDLFPARFRLVEGRWPARPDEVVVTRSEVLRQVGDSLPVFAGRSRLRVVGLVDDRYERYPTALAAPGTWQAMDGGIREAFPTATAYPTVYWNGPHASEVTDAIARSTGGGPVPVRIAAEVAAEPEQSWVQRVPAAYSVPSLCAPVLAILLVFAINGRRFRRNHTILVALGVPAQVARAGVALAVLAWSIVAVVLGALTGFGLGAALRPAVEHLRHQPLAPLTGPGAPLLRLLLATVIGAVLSAATLRPIRPAPAHAPRPPRTRKWRIRDVRHLLALAAAALAVLQLTRLDAPANAMLLAATFCLAVLLMTPEAVAFTVKRLPQRSPRTRLAVRRLASDPHRAVVAVALFSLALGAPLGFLSLLDTFTASAQAERLPAIAAGQVALSGRGGLLQPPSMPVAQVVRTQVQPPRPPIQLRHLTIADRFVFIDGTDGGFILAVDSTDEVGRLIDRNLPAPSADALRQGGLLVWDGAGSGPRRLATESDDRIVARTEPLPGAAIDFSEVAWKAGTRGVMLTSTAQRLGLPISSGALIYTDLSPAQVTAARQAVLQAGLDVKQVVSYHPPDLVVPPAAYPIGAAGLLGLILLTGISVARGQAATLRGYLGMLVAIGLPVRWTRRVLLTEYAVIVAISTTLALLIAIPPVVATAWRVPDSVLRVPLPSLAIVLITYYVATFATMAAATRHLRARTGSQ